MYGIYQPAFSLKISPKEGKYSTHRASENYIGGTLIVVDCGCYFFLHQLIAKIHIQYFTNLNWSHLGMISLMKTIDFQGSGEEWGRYNLPKYTAWISLPSKTGSVTTDPTPLLYTGMSLGSLKWASGITSGYVKIAIEHDHRHGEF